MIIYFSELLIEFLYRTHVNYGTQANPQILVTLDQSETAVLVVPEVAMSE